MTIRTILGLSLTLPILTSSVAWSQEPSTREEADRLRREEMTLGQMLGGLGNG